MIGKSSLVNGKQKGAGWEREVSVKLSLWVSGGEHEDYYWRSSMSGGRSTVAAKRGKRLAAQAGDISCINPLGSSLTDKFYIELKFYKSLDFAGLLKGTGNLAKFWIETRKQAQLYRKEPLLIAKQNQCPAIACFAWSAIYSPITLAAPKLHLWAVLLDELLATKYSYGGTHG